MNELSKVEDDEIDPKVLEDKGIIKKACKRVKILGNGKLDRSIKVIADAFSNKAREEIIRTGGEAIIRKPGE